MFTDDQIQAMGDDHHRGRNVRCPICGTPLKATSRQGMGPKKSIDLYLRCPRCGESGFYNTTDTTDPGWIEAESKKVIDDFWRFGGSTCPRDQARLGFIASHSSNFVRAYCPICGRWTEAGGH